MGLEPPHADRCSGACGGAGHIDVRIRAQTYSLILLAYVRGDARNLKAGEYNFEQGITPRQLLDQVVAGRVIEYPLALIEGWTFDQFLEAIRHAKSPERSMA
jgi:UPF0755 protein